MIEIEGSVITGEEDSEFEIRTDNIAEMLQTTRKKFLSLEDPDIKVTGKELLKEIWHKCKKSYTEDRDSTSEMRVRNAKMMRMFSGTAEPKTSPWPGASNIVLPISSMASLQFHARVLEHIIPATNAVKTMPNGINNLLASERVAKYMNHDISVRDQESFDTMDKTLLQLPILGSVVRKIYWDFENNVIVRENISSDDFVVNYHATSMKSAKVKTHILRETVNDIRIKVDSGFYVKDSWDLKHGSGQEEDVPMKTESDKISKVESPPPTQDTPRISLEQHRDLDLDGDGIAEPYIITFDSDEEHIHRITSRTVTNKFTGKEEVLEIFVKYDFLPNPEGFYGYGFGLLLLALNESNNTLINMIMDGGKLHNLSHKTGFVSRRAGIRGMTQMVMGKYVTVDVSADDIKKAIYNINFSGPSPVLFQTLSILFEFAKLLTGINEVTTGKQPSSDTTATAAQLAANEGAKFGNSIIRRTHKAYSNELRIEHTLNRLFLDQETYVAVVGNLVEDPNEVIGKEDFASVASVVPVSDPAITSKSQQITLAQIVKDEIRTNPVTANNIESQRVALVRYLKVIGEENVEQLVPAPEPPKDTPPQEENANFIIGLQSPVLPFQNHENHNAFHEEFMDSDQYKDLPTHSKKLHEQHMAQHDFFQYMKEQNLLDLGLAKRKTQEGGEESA